MNFSEAVTTVLGITKRPDKAVETARAINRAISYCTLKGGFRQDLVEATLAVDATLYGGTISISGLTRFRRFSYVKPTGVKYYLNPVAEDKIFTPQNTVQPNAFYVAGTSLTYTLGALSTALEVGYYTHAPVLDAITVPTYWMLDVMDYAIVDLAAARIFDLVGDDASAAKYEKSGMDFYLATRRDLAQGD